MCGIIGVFNNPKAEVQVQTALALLHNRGKDGSNILKLAEKNALGHTLHAINNHIPQPIKKEGILTANCEIYNWQELNEQHHFSAKNDAELLLHFLDKYGMDDIEKLDGVFAFAYYKDNQLFLARDLLGEKPLWFVHTADAFAFASERNFVSGGS